MLRSLHVHDACTLAVPDPPRYDEATIAEIFRRAADLQTRADSGAHEGLSLEELQQIGREAGLDPLMIAQAAAAVSASADDYQPRRLLGVPYTVQRSVPLPGPVSDDEWETIVGELRETFRARGRVRESGGLREWYNGNLHAVVEQTESGYRLRMATLKGVVREAVGISAVFAVVFGAIAAMLWITEGFLDPGAFALLGILVLGAFAWAGWHLWQLPDWAERRASQMEAIGNRAQKRAWKKQAAQLEAAPDGDLLDLDIGESESAEIRSRESRRTR